jgi:multidrug efflux pump subunit AcrA (membrane-fusion protein)
VSISFDSIPERTFEGDVSEITPQLVTANGTSAIQAVVTLAPVTLSNQQSLPIGLNASAEVICGEANNVLVIPVEALHKLSDGTTAVFVLAADGKPEQRLVETGLQDYTNVEIRSGLQAGELVITQGPGIPG